MKSNQALVDVNTSEELDRWNEFLKQIAENVPLADACLAAGVTSKEITVFTLNPLEACRWADARLMAKRRRWPQLQLDDIFERFAAGMEVEAALVEIRGSSEDAGEFFELMDIPDLADRYAAAQRARALRNAESLRAIADDDSKDTLPGPKGGEIPNMANVQRSRLRIETRQALNAAWHPDRFSEKKNQVNVQVNIDHAGTLEASRERAKARGKSPKINQRVIDAAFTPVGESPVEPAVEPKAAADHMRAAAVAECSEPTPAVQAPEQPVESFGLDD